MSQPEHFEVVILGSGFGGKLLAWHLARSGRRTAAVERRWIGGSCPNIACMPSKNEIWSARVAYLARHGAQFGAVTGPVTTDMAKASASATWSIARSPNIWRTTKRAARN
jgi:pyruvate/2-oxoglutarate dehydrogenase complex dihydrolipoamide dehydrogenase (E3) component